MAANTLEIIQNDSSTDIFTGALTANATLNIHRSVVIDLIA